MIRKLNIGLVSLFMVLGFLACKPQTKSKAPDESEAGDVVGEDPFGDDETGVVPAPGEIIPVDEPLYDPPLPPSTDDSPEGADTEEDASDKPKESEPTDSSSKTQVVSVDLSNLAGNKVYAINASGQADWLSQYKAGEYIMVWGALGESFSLTKATTQGSSRSLSQSLRDRIFGSKTSDGKSDPTRKENVDTDTDTSSVKSEDDSIVADLKVDDSGLSRDDFVRKDSEEDEVQFQVPSVEEKQTLAQRAKTKFLDLKKKITERYNNVTPEEKKRYKQLGIVAAISVSLTLIVALPAALAGKGSAVEEALSQGEESTAQCLDSQECVVIGGKVYKLDRAASLEELACLYDPKTDQKGNPVVVDGKQQYSCNVENGKIIGSMNQSSGTFSAGDGGDILVYDHSDCVKNFGSEQSCQKKPIRLSEMKSVGTQTIVGVVIDPATGELTKKWVSVQGEVLEPTL